jgi:hypothetical protein
MREKKDNAATGSILTTAMIAIGSAGIGASPNYISLTDMSKVSVVGWIFFILSASLFAVAVLAQVRKWI